MLRGMILEPQMSPLMVKPCGNLDDLQWLRKKSAGFPVMITTGYTLKDPIIEMITTSYPLKSHSFNDYNRPTDTILVITTGHTL